jgi:steroid 5-alpha reductase family enzyme
MCCTVCCARYLRAPPRSRGRDGQPVINSPWLALALATLTVATIMLVLWLLAIRHRNFSYVDIGWSANFAVLGVLYAVLAPGWPARKWTLAAMYSLHGLRLAWHLAKRIIGEPEEGRYVQLRKDWGTSGNVDWKFLAFFEFQAILNAFLSLPLLIASFNSTAGFAPLEFAGIAIFALGLLGEVTADAQLAAFKRDPANNGGVCDRGLWGYSRNPNYFCEWLIWIGYAAFALASPFGWIGLAMPLVMLHFLVNVTGLKATEEQALRSKGERYRLYQARTSGFVPWFPRRACAANAQRGAKP